ncbi:MAG: hypothetical protein RLZZ598_1542 [Pseudomonadota bacterium]|jgi:hypothetical protein
MKLKMGLSAMALLAVTSAPTLAAGASASSVGSSAVGGSSASVGVSSDSIGTSSNKSSNSSKTEKVAEGTYKVIELAAAEDRPGRMRLKLQPLVAGATAESFELYLPLATVEQARLAEGGLVAALHRPYGLEFAHADSGKAFFLVLHDGWHRDIASHPVAG